MLQEAARTDTSANGHINRPGAMLRPKNVTSVRDSGAQSCPISKSLFQYWGMKPKNIVPVF